MHYSINSEYNRACRALIDLAIWSFVLWSELQTDITNRFSELVETNRTIKPTYISDSVH